MQQRIILTFLSLCLLILPAVPASRLLELSSSRLTASPQDVQDATVSAHPDDGDSLVVADGTPLRIEVLRGFSSEKAKVGDVIDFAVALDVRVGGVVVIPQRTSLVGTVVSVSRAHRRAKNGQVGVAYEALTLPTRETATVRLSLKPPHKHSKVATKTAEAAEIAAMSFFTGEFMVFYLLQKGNEQIIPEGTLAVVYLNGPLHISRKTVMALQPKPGSGYAYVYVEEGVIVRRRDLSLPKLFCGGKLMDDASRGLQVELPPGTYWFSTDNQDDRPARVDVIRSHEYFIRRNSHGLLAKEFQTKTGHVYPHQFVHKDFTMLTPEEYGAMAAEPAKKKN